MDRASVTTAHTASQALFTRDQVRIAVAVIIGGLPGIFDTTIVAVALRSLAQDLSVSLTTIQWVTTGYLLALSMAIPLVAWAELRLGSRRLWIVGSGIFLLGSICCACAWNAPSLIAFRMVQGVGSGVLMPLMQSIMLRNAPAERMGQGMAVVSLPIALGPILGPVLGGLILAFGSWRWLFLINVPLGIAGLILAALFLPDDVPGRPRGLDVLGLLLVAPGLFLLLLGLANTESAGGFAHADVVIPLVGGALLLGGFVLHALRRGEQALVVLSALRRRSTAVGTACLFLTGAALFGALFLLPLYWQVLRGDDALMAGLLLIPQGVGMLLSRTVAGRATDARGPRIVALIGFAVVALGTLPFAFADASTPVWWLAVALTVRGAGIGVVFIPTMTASYAGLPQEQVADTSILTRVFQQVGGSVGTAVLAVILQHVSSSSGSVAAFQQSFWWALAFAAVAAVASLLLPGCPDRKGVVASA